MVLLQGKHDVIRVKSESRGVALLLSLGFFHLLLTLATHVLGGIWGLVASFDGGVVKSLHLFVKFGLHFLLIVSFEFVEDSDKQVDVLH